jgi:Protein of unknown function (DUF2752)
MSATPVLGGVRQRDVRIGGVALVGLAAAWKQLPVHPSFHCPLRTLTGVPCPFCGMTRACIAAAHGHIGQSLAYNPGGILVFVAAIVLIVRPSWLRRVRVPLWTVGIAVGALWLWNIGFNPTFHQYFL